MASEAASVAHHWVPRHSAHSPSARLGRGGSLDHARQVRASEPLPAGKAGRSEPNSTGRSRQRTAGSCQFAIFTVASAVATLALHSFGRLGQLEPCWLCRADAWTASVCFASRHRSCSRLRWRHAQTISICLPFHSRRLGGSAAFESGRNAASRLAGMGFRCSCVRVASSNCCHGSGLRDCSAKVSDILRHARLRGPRLHGGSRGESKR